MALDSATETFGIAQLAREFSITTRAIRFYEDKGMLAPARDGQRRVYSARDRVRLRLIMRGKRLGFALEEIRELIDLYDSDPTEVSQLRLFLEKIREHRSQLRQQRDDIAETLAEMEKLEAESAALLAERDAMAGGPGSITGQAAG